MASINKYFARLAQTYLFSDISKRTQSFSQNHPGIEVMKLGIGNTTESIVPSVVKGMLAGVKKLAAASTYSGYGDEQGDRRLREALSSWYKKNKVRVDPLEVFVSDGAKSDSANISSLFAQDSVIAVQDPVYPVYVDSNVIGGHKDFVYLTGTEENNFFSEPPGKKVDLIFLCSPNNPTGAVATKKQLKSFVDWAIKNKAVIIFDAAYSFYISDKTLPKSIYEIPGAKKCAIEIQSFSKWAGFTGVRLGWTVVPMDLACKGTVRGKLNSMWRRRQTTMFNGASNIAQEGGLAVLSSAGQKECKKLVEYYMGNAKIIRDELSKIGLVLSGGVNAPYIWLKVPSNLSSWEFFDKLLAETHVVGTPGSGFGPAGEGYLRLSAFGHRQNIIKAVKSIRKNLKI